MTAKDLGGETVLASLVHNPTCLKALKSFFLCRPTRSASKKLPRSNPYRMPSALKNARGRHSLRHYNPHNIESLLSSANSSVTDASTGKTTDSTSDGVAQQNASEVVVPSLCQPEGTSSVANMIDQLVKKHIKNELSKDIIGGKQQTAASDVTTTATAEVVTSTVDTDDTQAEDVVRIAIPNAQLEDNIPSAPIGRLSPLFPNLTDEEDLKPKEKKISVSTAHTDHTSILQRLTNNWSLIVTTILGICVPSCEEEPRGIPTDHRVEYSSQACDHFIQELLYNCDYAVAECIGDTIIGKLNDGLAADRWTLDDVLQLEDEGVVVTEDNVALIVVKKFIHSIVRLLAIELSDPVIGGEENSERANKNKSVIVLIQ